MGAIKSVTANFNNCNLAIHNSILIHSISFTFVASDIYYKENVQFFLPGTA